MSVRNAGWMLQRAILAVALVSGTSALIYESIWIRWFRLLFGSTAYAASATLSAFFAGLALGAWYFGDRSRRSANPLWLYAKLEAGIAVAAIWVPLVVSLYQPVYQGLYGGLAEQRFVFLVLKFSLAVIAMLPASILIGGTLPVLAQVALRDVTALGREGNRLYAINTAGAALGAVLAALLLPEWIGVPFTYAIGIAGSVAIGVVAAAMSRGWREDGAADAVPEPASAVGGAALRGPLVIAFASGFGTLALEVLLIHALEQLYLHSAYSFGVVLVVVLASLAISAAVVAASAGRVRVWVLMASCLVGEALFLLLAPALLVTRMRAVEGLALHDLSVNLGLAAFGVNLFLAGMLALPAFVIGGMIFPLALRIVNQGSVGARLGSLVAANTVGGILGSIAASFVLLETIGLWGAIGLLGVAYLLSAVVVAPTARARVAVATACAGLLALAWLAPINAWKTPSVQLLEGEKLLAFEHGAHGIVSVVETANGHRRIKIDDQYQFGSSAQLPVVERTAHLPMLLHPNPRRVAVIGSATGSLAGAVSLHPVEQIDMVEIVPEVHRLAARHFREFNRAVHDDPRARLISEDGRNHLRATPERYDVIIEDLFVPARPGAASMYTADHYREARARLRESGIFCQWLPIYQLTDPLLRIILATFLEVYPDATLWRASASAKLPMLALVGSTGPWPGVGEVEGRALALRGLGIRDRWLTDPIGIWLLHVGSARHAFRRGEALAINRDRHPIFEFKASRNSLRSVLRYRFVGWPELSKRISQSSFRVREVFAGRPYASHAGAAGMLEANLAYATRRQREAARAWERAMEALPASLLASPDYSFSEVWPVGEARANGASRN